MAVLMNGPQPWDQEIADMLTKDMFIGREACQVGGYFKGQLKPPADKRIQAFKRLCDPAHAIEMLEQVIKTDKESPLPGDYYAKRRAVIPGNLALLKS